MAKGFLSTLDNAFEESMLLDVIPMGKSKQPSRQKKSASSTSKSRKKSFLDALDQALSQETASKPPVKSKPKTRRKSFLATLEEAFDDPALDELIPMKSAAPSRKKKGAKKAQSRLSTSLDSELMIRVRKYAEIHNLRIKEVLEAALNSHLGKK